MIVPPKGAFVGLITNPDCSIKFDNTSLFSLTQGIVVLVQFFYTKLSSVQEATNSHYYKSKADGINEKWVELRDNYDWKALEQVGFKP